MYINIYCSCCGNRRGVSNKKVEYTINAIKQGWGSCGSALYCPECSKSWRERNNKPMADERNTFFVIMSVFMQAMSLKKEVIK